MRIESVNPKPDRAGRYYVRLEDGTVLRLYRQTVEDFGLYGGQELTAEQLEKLQVDAGQMSAKMRAVRIVSASAVSRQDLEERLIRKGESPEQARVAVDWMDELNLLDDRETARQIVSRCITRGYGLARAKQALYERKIPKELWQDVLEDYPDQTGKILEFLRSRLGSQWDEKERNRAIQALMRRGHSYTQIRQALQELELELDDFQEE